MYKENSWHIDKVINHLEELKKVDPAEFERNFRNLAEHERLRRCEFAKSMLGDGGDLFVIDVGGQDE